MKRFTWIFLGMALAAWVGYELPLEQVQHLLSSAKTMSSGNLLEMFLLLVLLRMRAELVRRKEMRQSPRLTAAEAPKTDAPQAGSGASLFVEEGNPPTVEPDQGSVPPQRVAFVEEGDPPPVEPDQGSAPPQWVASVEEGDPPPVEPVQGSTPPQRVAFVEEGDPSPVEADQGSAPPQWVAFVEEGDPQPVEPEQGSIPPTVA